MMIAMRKGVQFNTKLANDVNIFHSIHTEDILFFRF